MVQGQDLLDIRVAESESGIALRKPNWPQSKRRSWVWKRGWPLSGEHKQI